jgi:hypothetical protein
MSPGSEPGIGILIDWEAVEKLAAPRCHCGEELTQARPPMLDQTSWNRHELLKGWALSGRNPATYYLGLNLCRCSILIIARSAQQIASE